MCYGFQTRIPRLTTRIKKLLCYDLGNIRLLWLLLLYQDIDITTFVAVFGMLAVISKKFNVKVDDKVTYSNITAASSNVQVIFKLYPKP